MSTPANSNPTSTISDKLKKVQVDLESFAKPIDPWKPSVSDGQLRKILKGFLESELKKYIIANKAQGEKSESWKQIKALGDLLVQLCCEEFQLGRFAARRLLIVLQVQQDVVEIAAAHRGTIPDPGAIEISCEMSGDGEVVRKIDYKPGQAKLDGYDEIAYGLFDMLHGGRPDLGFSELFDDEFDEEDEYDSENETAENQYSEERFDRLFAGKMGAQAAEGRKAAGAKRSAAEGSSGRPNKK